MKNPSARLVHALIGKSIVETLVVGALAVFTFITVLPAFFHGWGEVTETGISGWAVNNASPWERVEVQLFIDGKFFADEIADQHRPDVSAAGWAKDAWHGYAFVLTSLPVGDYKFQLHEARVYALHDSGNGARKSLQLLGSPIWFTVVDGKVFADTSRKSPPY
ncbi:MAG: hypothetical protein ACRD9S_11565 [Pyrinomonadaceae bacterium]